MAPTVSREAELTDTGAFHTSCFAMISSQWQAPGAGWLSSQAFSSARDLPLAGLLFPSLRLGGRSLAPARLLCYDPSKLKQG